MRWVIIMLVIIMSSIAYAADVKISELPDGGPTVAVADTTVIVQGGVTKRTTLGEILGIYVGLGGDGYYGLSLKNNTSTFAPQSGYTGGFTIIGNLPYAYFNTALKALVYSGGAANFATTGTITGRTKIVTVTGSCTVGTDCDSTSTAGLDGGMFLATATAVVTLSAGAVGQMACFMERDVSEALSVKPASGEQIVLNGTLLDANHKVTSASGAGDFICLAFLESGKWYSLGRSGTWTDGAE
jgi:hypothetical protein